MSAASSVATAAGPRAAAAAASCFSSFRTRLSVACSGPDHAASASGVDLVGGHWPAANHLQEVLPCWSLMR